LEERTVPGVIRITIAAKGRYFFSQKSATVKIVHWGRLGIDLGPVVSREFFSSLTAWLVRLLWVLSF
jgi:hypothetical protein